MAPVLTVSRSRWSRCLPVEQEMAGSCPALIANFIRVTALIRHRSFLSVGRSPVGG